MKNRTLLTALSSVGCCLVAAYLVNHHKMKQLNPVQKQLETLLDHYRLLNHWLEIKNEGKSVASYFEEMGYSHIAVYGMAELGNRLMEDLESTSIHVDYGIDQDVSCSIARIEEVYFPEDDLPKTDAIVVTPYSAFGAIKKQLEEKVKCPIISLEEVVWSV